MRGLDSCQDQAVLVAGGHFPARLMPLEGVRIAGHLYKAAPAARVMTRRPHYGANRGPGGFRNPALL
jgi:hypothetical protein